MLLDITPPFFTWTAKIVHHELVHQDMIRHIEKGHVLFWMNLESIKCQVWELERESRKGCLRCNQPIFYLCHPKGTPSNLNIPKFRAKSKLMPLIMSCKTKLTFYSTFLKKVLHEIQFTFAVAYGKNWSSILFKLQNPFF